MEQDIVVRVVEPGADGERLGALTSALAEEIQADGQAQARPLRSGRPPEGARAIDAESVGAMLVTVSGSMAALEAIVFRVRAWLRRGPADRSVEIKLGDRTLKVGSASEDQQSQLIAAFLEESARG